MYSQGGCKIWTLSEDQNQYERFFRLLNGENKHSLTPCGLNDAILSQGVSRLSGETCITVVHDPSDIRKPYAREMEELESVRDLKGRIIPGYKTFNSVAISEQDKRLHLLGCVPKKVVEAEVEEEKSVREQQMTQIQRCSEALHASNPQATLIHVLDREYDDQSIFRFLDQELEDRFVIRLKLNRVSPNEQVWDDQEQKEVYVKLKHKTLAHQFTQVLESFSWGGKKYGRVEARFSYEMLPLAGGYYGLVKVELVDAAGHPVFKHPMLLLSNYQLYNDQIALLVFRAYLRRAKIEGVFKFLKEYLGWESFQVRDLMAIQNIIVLCFFIGSYFYEIESELVHNEWMVQICRFGSGKGKVSKRFFLQGLAKIANYIEIRRFMQENDLNEEQLIQLFAQKDSFT